MSTLILVINKFPQINNVQKSFSLEYNTSTKFQNDKVNFENDNYYILIDGIILNKKHLLNRRNRLVEFLIESYKKYGSSFSINLKGSYYGFLFDKIANKGIIITDHISSKPMYYAEYNNYFVFSSDYTSLIKYLKKHGQRVTLNTQAAFLLLTYGYVFEDMSITNEIKRLMVGYRAIIHDGKISYEKYYELKNNPIEIKEKEAIEEVDIHFRDAVQLAFEKDNEYGYKHIATLSGGLDSRMTVWVAYDLG